MPAPGLVLCSTAPQTLVPALSTHWIPLGLLIPHTAPHPSGRVTALLLRNPPELPQRPSLALLIYFCKQANERGLRGCTPPHLHLQLAQHSTALRLGQSFSKFQSGFVSKSTFHYQHQVHFLALACLPLFTQPELFQALTNSCRIQQNSWHAASHSSNLPGCLEHREPASLSPMSPDTEHPKGSLNNQTDTSKTPAEAPAQGGCRAPSHAANTSLSNHARAAFLSQSKLVPACDPNAAWQGLKTLWCIC